MPTIPKKWPARCIEKLIFASPPPVSLRRGGLAVISDVPKTLVYRLCAYVNSRRKVIPETTMEKPPSAELRADQKDSDSLPPYDVLDAILEGARGGPGVGQSELRARTILIWSWCGA